MPPVVLTANAETVPEPELLTKAKLAVCPGAIGELLFVLHPEANRSMSRQTAKVKGITCNRVWACWVVEIMRTIYAAQGVGVGRVLRYYITEAEANQLFIYNSTMLIDAQAEALTIAYTVQNKGIDVFLLLQWDPIPGGTVGLSPVGGTCDKHDDCTMTGSVVSLETGPNTGAVLAHEVGHYLGLSHINGLSAAQIDLNGDGVIDPGVPASIVNNVMCPIESVPTPSFNNLQGASIHLHCFMRPGC